MSWIKVIATVLPKTSTLLCHFHVGKKPRVKYITGYKVELKVVKVDVKANEVGIV